MVRVFEAAVEVTRTPAENYRQRVEGWLGNLGAVAYFPDAEIEDVNAKRRPKRGSVHRNRERGWPVELLIRRSEGRCLCCGETVRKPKKAGNKSRTRPVDHCRACAEKGEAAKWRRSQHEAINYFLMKVTPLILQGQVRNRARERRARRSARPRAEKRAS